MFIKLGIIVGIVVLAGMIFSNEIDILFPTTSATVIDSFKDDVTDLGEKASSSVEQKLDSSIGTITDTTTNSITNEVSEAGEKITTEISEVSNFDPFESIKNIFTGNSNPNTSEPSVSSTVSETTNSPETKNNTPLTYETLSLSTKQQSDENILLQYSDSSQKTKSVNVVIRTEQKEIFSGIFFTSMFETTINDATSIPYYVDLIIEHEEYGTVTSSVFNPGDNSDSKINGIFSKNN